MRVQTIALLVVSAAIAAGRFAVPGHPLSWAGSYEAVAHLFVGGLVGAWLVSSDRLYLVLTVLLTVVEVVAFVALRGG